MSFNVVATTVVILVISHSCGWTKAQEVEPAIASNDPKATINPTGIGLPGSGPEPGFEGIDGRVPRWPRDALGTDEIGFRTLGASERTGDLESDDNNSQRFFFHHFGYNGERVPCNFTTQAGVSCTSCNQLLTCTQRGGRLKACTGYQRYCTDGRCTFRQSDACAATTTTSTTTVATTGSNATTEATQTTTG